VAAQDEGDSDRQTQILAAFAYEVERGEEKDSMFYMKITLAHSPQQEDLDQHAYST